MRTLLASAPLLVASLAACEGGGGDDPSDAGPTEVALVDGNNYTFDGALDIRSTEVAAPSDPLIDWSRLTADLQGHALDPEVDLDQAAVILFRDLTEEEVEAGLSTESLDQASVSLYVSLTLDGQTSAHLSELTLFGNDVDVEQYLEEGSGTWLFLLATGTTPGVGTRMAAFLAPSAAGTGSTVEVDDDSTVLDFDVDLRSLEPVPVAAETPEIVVDWSSVTTTGQGQPLSVGAVDKVLVGHYLDSDLAALEESFLDLEVAGVADGLWQLAIASGTRQDLSELEGTDGTFPGVDDTGVWVLALMCTTCSNPAPPVLTVLVPASR